MDFIVDLIRRDEEGVSEDHLRSVAQLYNDYMNFRYEASMRLYRNLYSVLGSYTPHETEMATRFSIVLSYMALTIYAGSPPSERVPY